MNELLNVQNVTVIGCLLIAIGWLVKTNSVNINKQDAAYQDKTNYIIKNFEEEKDRHSQEEKELKEEIKNMHKERREERGEWLEALQSNTEQLKNVADKLQVIPALQADVQVIPALQADVDNIKDDVQLIKNKIK